MDDESIKLVAAGNDLTTEVNQRDALVHRADALAASYRVEWANINRVTDSGQKETSETAIHLNGLTPGATYNVSVTPLSGPLVGIKQQSSLTTQTISPNKSARLNFAKSEYAFGEDVVLSLLDYRGELKQIKWYIDGKLTEETRPNPARGEHTVMAVVVDASDMKEYIVKHITVK